MKERSGYDSVKDQREGERRRKNEKDEQEEDQLDDAQNNVNHDV